MCTVLISSAVLYVLDYRGKYYYPLNEAKERLTPYMDKICLILQNYGIETEGLIREETGAERGNKYYRLVLNTYYLYPNKDFGSSDILIVLERGKSGEFFHASFGEAATEDYYKIHDGEKKGYISEIITLLAGKKYSEEFIEYMYDKVREKIAEKGYMEFESFFKYYSEPYNFFSFKNITCYIGKNVNGYSGYRGSLSFDTRRIKK